MKDAIIRLVVLIAAIVNQVLTMSGLAPLPWSETDIGAFASTIITAGALFAAWWKNNSITAAAKGGDAVKDALKAGQITYEEVKSVLLSSNRTREEIRDVSKSKE